MSNTVKRLCILALLGPFSWCGQSHATILNFTGFAGNSQDYGDSVSASNTGGYSYGNGGEGFTPHITTAYYMPTASLGNWQPWSSANDLSGVIYPNNSGSGTARIEFTAAPNYNLTLYGFDFAGFGANTLNYLRILGSADNELYRQNSAVAPGAGHSSMTTLGWSSVTDTRVSIELSSPSLWLFAMDNIRIGESLIPPNVYWNGTGSSWSATGSWSTASGATTPNPASVPGAADLVGFNITTANTPQTVNLDAPQSAKGLVFSSTGSVAIQGGGSNQSLTLGTVGLMVNPGAGAVTIGSATSGQNVAISMQGAQSWLNNSSNPLTIANGVSIGAGGNQTLTLGGSNTGANVISGPITDGAGTLSITKADAGTWSLSGSNTYSGTTSVNAGTLKLGASNVLPDGSGKGNVSVAGTLDLNGNSETINGLSGAGTVDTLSGGAPVLTVGGNNATSAFSGVIKNTAGSLSLVKTGGGTQTLSGANTYTGGTTVNAGTLLLSGAVNMPSSGALTVNAGGNFSLADGTRRDTSAASLNLASGSNLTFDWVAGNVDKLTSTAAATTTGTVVIGINPLSSPSGTNLTLISSPSGGLDGANYVLANNTTFTASLSKTATALTIGSYSSAAALANAYWKGGQIVGLESTMAFSTGTSNWTTDLAGTLSTGLVPGSNANVFFTPGAFNNPVLGADMNVKSVTFNSGAGSVTIGAGNTLTINRTGTIDTPGITANETAAINANIALAVDQTWTVASGKTLTIGGAITGTNRVLQKEGAGALVLSNPNNAWGSGEFRIGHIASSPGTVTFGADNAIGAATLVDWGGTLDVGTYNVNIGANPTISAWWGPLTINGTGTLTSNGGSFGVSGHDVGADKVLTINARLGGSSKLGIGLNTNVINLNNSNNSYTGGTDLGGNQIVRFVSGALGTTGNITFANSATTLQWAAGNSQDISNRVVINNGITANLDTNGNQVAFASGFGGVSTGGIQKVGAGTLSLAGANTYAGTTTVTTGTLQWAKQVSLYNNTPANWTAAKLVVQSGATAAFNVGGVGEFTSGDLDLLKALGTASGGFRSGSTLGLDTTNASGGFVYNGALANTNGGSNVLSLSKLGANALTLGGTNTYTGTTAVNAGTLQWAKQASLYNNTPANWTATNLVVQSGATAAFNVGGSGEFSATNINTLKALGTATGGFRSGSTIGLDTSNAIGGNFVYSSNIANPNAGANVLGLTKLGASTLTLSGANTYSGSTSVLAGSLLVNGSHTGGAAYTVASGATLGGSGTIQSLIGGTGLGSPGNSPGILSVSQTDPSGGMDFAFELTQLGNPTWSNSAASGNDVWRVTHASTPFPNGPFDGDNVIDVYFSGAVANLIGGESIRGGFYTDLNSDFLSTVSGAQYNFWVLGDGLGSESLFGGQNYYSLTTFDSGLSMTVSAVQIASADFSGGPPSANGWVMQFDVQNNEVNSVPEPSTLALGGFALCGLALLGYRRVRW